MESEKMSLATESSRSRWKSGVWESGQGRGNEWDEAGGGGEEDGAETEGRDEGGRGEEETGGGSFFCALKRGAVEWTWRGGEGGVGGYHKNQVA